MKINMKRILLGITVATIASLAMTSIAADKTKKPAKEPVKSQIEKEIDGNAPELTKKTSEAITKGFQSLLKIQEPDGSWVNKSGGGMHAEQVRIANTSLCLLAFMVKGHFPGFGQYGDALEKAKNYLLRSMKKSSDGYLGDSMYEHGFAALALSEMWGMTKEETDDEEIEKALERTVEVIIRAQDPRGSWTYTPIPKLGDTSISITQLVALASSRQAGILVPDETIKRGIAYLKSCQSPELGGFGYNPKGKPTIACSAGSAYVLHLCSQRQTKFLEAGMDYLKALPDNVFQTKNYYYYTHYYGMQAMVQDSDESYAMWYKKVRKSMLERQNKAGYWSGGSGGIPQSTAMAILTLGTPYRFLPIYQR